jgi:hypothetical protein
VAQDLLLLKYVNIYFYFILGDFGLPHIMKFQILTLKNVHIEFTDIDHL